LECWDVEKATPKDLAKLQVFYNNILGEPFELRGERLRSQDVRAHRRLTYHYGEIPNKWASKHAGGPVQLLICSVDVQKAFLSVAVFGFTRGRRCMLIDYHRLDGDTADLASPDTWGKLTKLLQKRYVADDGTVYGMGLTLVDSGYRQDLVYQYVAKWRDGVVAVKGEPGHVKAAKGNRFHQLKTPLGEQAFGVTVDAYKERLHVQLRQGWDGMAMMPDGHFSAPVDVTDDQLDELTVERRVEELDPLTRQRKGWKWVRPSGSRNELWDLLVYATAGLDILAWEYCRRFHEPDETLWPMFWEHTSKGAFFRPTN